MPVTYVRSMVSPGIPISSTNKADRHDITEILLKVALNTITINPIPLKIFYKSKLFVIKFNYWYIFCKNNVCEVLQRNSSFHMDLTKMWRPYRQFLLLIDWNCLEAVCNQCVYSMFKFELTTWVHNMLKLSNVKHHKYSSTDSRDEWIIFNITNWCNSKIQ